VHFPLFWHDSQSIVVRDAAPSFGSYRGRLISSRPSAIPVPAGWRIVLIPCIWCPAYSGRSGNPHGTGRLGRLDNTDRGIGAASLFTFFELHFFTSLTDPDVFEEAERGC
jgi:hypothetical protein